MLYGYERLWHCRMRCAVVHYAVCMWAAHLAVFMYGCALVQYVGGTLTYGCAIVQYVCCMYVGGTPSCIYVLWVDLAGLHAEPCGGVAPALLPILYSTCTGGSRSCKAAE